MTTSIEAVFEDKVLKPLKPIEGIREHERVWALIRPLPKRDVLKRLIGSLTSDEARNMREVMDREFEKVEGEW